MQTPTPLPSPAAELIERRRKARGISVRQAARDAKLSEGRWRQIAKGYQQVAKNVKVPVNAPDETLARMAVSVGVQADELDIIGATEVASMVRSQAQSRLRHPMHGPEGGTTTSLLSDDALLNELAERLRQGAEARRELMQLKIGAAATYQQKEGGSGGDAAPNTPAGTRPALADPIDDAGFESPDPPPAGGASPRGRRGRGQEGRA